MDTPTSPTPNENDHRPLDQQDRAAQAQPNVNDPIRHASHPNYGTFGVAESPVNSSEGRSGANDNPDEFSEFDDRERKAQEAPDNQEDQPGHIMQNQATELVREVEAEGGDNAELRAAWAADDPRYAGGGTHNTRDEDADANYPKNDD